MQLSEILRKNNCIVLSKVIQIDAANTKDVDVLCEKPDKILKEISKYYKIIWSAPNLTSGVTASIWDADNRQIFRIDLVKNLCLITERTYPLRLRSTLTIDDMDKPQNLENFRNLRKKNKKTFDITHNRSNC